MSEHSIEQQIVKKLRQLNETQQRRVLEFVDRASRQPAGYSASELLRLPADERERAVAAAFEAAADEDFEVFEAYSEKDENG
jgi:hypothetical protein